MRNTLVLFGVLAMTLSGAAVALAAGAHSTGESYSYRATLSGNSEVPKPKAAANASGTFTATVTEIGKRSTVRWKLTFKGLSGPALAAHPPRQARRGRPRDRPALRAVQVRRHGSRHDDPRPGREARERHRVRERPHREEPGWGDPRPAQADHARVTRPPAGRGAPLEPSRNPNPYRVARGRLDRPPGSAATAEPNAPAKGVMKLALPRLIGRPCRVEPPRVGRDHADGNRVGRGAD